MKRVLSMLLALAMVCCMLPTVAFAADIVESGTCGENLTWTLDSEGTLTISGNGAMSGDTPWKYWDEDIVTVIIEDGVTVIEEHAFSYCKNLTSVTISNGVTSIGGEAFAFCDNLVSVEIPDSVTDIGWGAFDYCPSLASITIPAGVTRCPTFWECHALSRIYFRGDAPAMGEFTFVGVLAVAYYYGDNATWTEDVMQNYGGSIIWTTYESEESGGGEMLSGTCGDNLTWTIVDRVLTISGTGPMRDYSDEDCAPWCGKYITEVVIEDGVTTIGEKAFFKCHQIASVTIPDSVNSIGKYACFYCKSLPSVNIPDGVTTIEEGALRGCTNLTSVNIPDGVITIEPEAFAECDSLTSVTFPDSITAIESYAFWFCDSLEEIYFRGDAVAFGESAFWLIPYQDYLLTAYYPENNPTWTEDVMAAAGENITWVSYDPNASGGDEAPTSGTCGENVTWSMEEGTLTISGIGAIDDYESRRDTPWFSHADQIETLVIEEGVTAIGDGCFIVMDLADVYLPASLETIKVGAFGCDGGRNIENLHLADLAAWCEVEFVSQFSCNPVSYAKNLYINGEQATELIIPDGVVSISDYAFYMVPVERLEIAESVTDIGSLAFSFSKLKSMTIHSALASVGEQAFYGTLVEEMTFTSDAPADGYNLFNIDWPGEYTLSPADITAYYPAGNTTWTEEIMNQDYQANITWVSYESEIPGDTDGDGIVDDSDVAQLLWYTLFPDAYAVSGNADINADSAIDDADVAYLLWHTLFPDAYPLN